MLLKIYKLLGRAAYWLAWPGSWLYLRGSRRTRGLIVCGDEILVLKNWLGSGKWNLPGGGLHPGEDPAAGLLRELQEETGIRLTASDLRMLRAEPYRHHGFSYTCCYYAAELGNKLPVHRQKAEITAVMWAPVKGIDRRRFGPDVLRALELLDTR